MDNESSKEAKMMVMSTIFSSIRSYSNAQDQLQEA